MMQIVFPELVAADLSIIVTSRSPENNSFITELFLYEKEIYFQNR